MIFVLCRSHAGLCSQRAWKTPVTLPTQPYHNGGLEWGAKLNQFSHFRAAPSPLFPVAHPNTSPQPVIQFWNRAIVLRNSEIVHPATGILRKLLETILHRDRPTPASQMFYRTIGTTMTPPQTVNLARIFKDVLLLFSIFSPFGQTWFLKCPG